jgi:phage terminase small subunit
VPTSGLTSKQRQFVREYLIDRNATQAAIRVGYRAQNADVTGPRLLKVPAVAQEIETQSQFVQERASVTAEYVLRNLKEIVERCMQRVPAEEENWSFNAAGALRALELLGKHLGLFKDKVQLDGVDDLAGRLQRARERRQVMLSWEDNVSGG